MERKKIELITCTIIGFAGLGVAFLGLMKGDEQIANAGSAISTFFPILGVFRLLS